MTLPDSEPKLQLSRRQLIKAGAGAALSLAALPHLAWGSPKEQADFTFMHITDTHIQPELGATRGVAKAFEAVNAIPEKPAFALVGGDLVMDANQVPQARADMVYDLWHNASLTLNMPLHYSIGNHDVFAEDQMSNHATPTPDFGKGMWMRRTGASNSYSTFDHGGWRFIILDSIQVSPDGQYHGGIDAAQMTWVDNLLRQTSTTMPIVFLTHVPIFTMFGMVTKGTTVALDSSMICDNGEAFREMIQPYNVKAVLQGHTHIREDIMYGGIRYISGGAVCGAWWKGTWLGVNHEGFGVVNVKNGDLSYRYVQYGWTPVSP